MQQRYNDVKVKQYKEQMKWKSEITEWVVTFSLSLMDPFPRIDIFVRVSSCSLFNEFPRGPRSLPTKLNCNREQERRSITICVFEIKSKDISDVNHMWLNQPLKLMKTYQQFFPVGVLIGSVWEHFWDILLRSNVSLLMGYGFILHENALPLTLCQKALAEHLR